MKLSAAFALWQDFFMSLCAGLPFLLAEIWADKSLLFRPKALSHIFFNQVWIVASDIVDEGGRTTKKELITPNASGIILDLGSGFGHTLRYLDCSKVTKYIALEPNAFMHARIREQAYQHNFHEDDGSLIILSCGAQETAKILSGIPPGQSVDTIISILTLCTVPSPEKSIQALVDGVLKPGGQLLFYEHVLSHRSDVAWWQRLWSPVWSAAFDGCRLDRPSHLYIRNMTKPDEKGKQVNMWKEGATWAKDEEPEEHLFCHQAGRFVKV